MGNNSCKKQIYKLVVRNAKLTPLFQNRCNNGELILHFI